MAEQQQHASKSIRNKFGKMETRRNGGLNRQMALCNAQGDWCVEIEASVFGSVSVVGKVGGEPMSWSKVFWFSLKTGVTWIQAWDGFQFFKLVECGLMLMVETYVWWTISQMLGQWTLDHRESAYILSLCTKMYLFVSNLLISHILAKITHLIICLDWN